MKPAHVLPAAMLGALLFEVAPVAAQEVRPSFDCRRAQFADERAICGDDKLAQMDQAAAIAMGQIGKDMMKSARKDAFERLSDRHACGSNRVCILDNQAQVISTLNDYGAKVQVPPWVGSVRLELLKGSGAPFVPGMPKRVGECTRTKIAGITTRFGDELKRSTEELDSQGSAADFSNGGHQVSYSFVEDLASSAIGDPVTLCLVSIPRHCPPGDERGRFYSATNMRTKGSWIMPDAQHMCGGA